MKLGDIFAKLAQVELRSIVKWYGLIVIWGAFWFLIISLLWVMMMVLLAIVPAVPWWLWVIFIVLSSGFIAEKVTHEEKGDYDYFPGHYGKFK